MKDWIVCRTGRRAFWLTRIHSLPDGRADYLCGFCSGPLTDQVVAFFESSRGSPGIVACSICERCDLLLDGGALAPCTLDEEIERVLATAGRRCKPPLPKVAP